MEEQAASPSRLLRRLRSTSVSSPLVHHQSESARKADIADGRILWTQDGSITLKRSNVGGTLPHSEPSKRTKMTPEASASPVDHLGSLTSSGTFDFFSPSPPIASPSPAADLCCAEANLFLASGTTATPAARSIGPAEDNSAAQSHRQRSPTPAIATISGIATRSTTAAASGSAINNNPVTAHLCRSSAPPPAQFRLTTQAAPFTTTTTQRSSHFASSGITTNSLNQRSSSAPPHSLSGHHHSPDPAILAMLRTLCITERSLGIDPTYLDTRHGTAKAAPRTYIDSAMRATVVSWLIEVVSEFEISQDALHLAISVLDRFLSTTRAVPRCQLQLVGSAALFVACKHEEEQVYSVHDFASIADNCFLPDDLRRMEHILLSCLGFHVASPTVHSCLALLRGALRLPDQVYALASYFVELALLDYSLLSQPPSSVACGAIALAAARFGDERSLCMMPQVIHGAATKALCCKDQLIALQRSAIASAESGKHSVFTPVFEKYSDPKRGMVALLPPADDLSALEVLAASYV